MKMSQWAIASNALGGSLHHRIQAAAQAGFGGLEVHDADLDGPASAATTRKVMQDYGLRAVSLQPFRDFEGYSGMNRRAAFDRANRYLDLCASIGAEMMLVVSSNDPTADADLSAMAADLNELGTMARERGCRIGYEALSWGLRVSRHEQAWHLVTQAAHDNVGVVLDNFHSQAILLDESDISAMDAKKIFLVQVSDAPRLDIEVIRLSRGYRCLPGSGAMDPVGFVHRVQDVGYDGALSLELFCPELRAMPADRACELAMQSIRQHWVNVG